MSSIGLKADLFPATSADNVLVAVLIEQEVLPLGSKQSLSNGNEPEEVTDLLCAFAQQNKVLITITCDVTFALRGCGGAWAATATNAHTDPEVRRRWDLVSVSCPAKEYKTLLGLLTGLLYKLDFEIGEAEMRAIGIKSA